MMERQKRRRFTAEFKVDRLDAALDWPAMEMIVAGIYASREGGLSYPLLTAVDEGNGLVRKAVMTPVDVHDSVMGDGLVQGDEKAVYADKTYDSAERRAGLRTRAIAPRIMYQARRNRPFRPWQVAFNKAVAPVWARVERLFGNMKRTYGYRQVRYLRLARNDVQLQALCVAINLRRALALGLA